MNSAAIAGFENGQGLAVGSVGVARAGDLPDGIAYEMIERAAIMGPEIMDLRAATELARELLKCGLKIVFAKENAWHL